MGTARGFFGLIGAIGAVACVAHTILFFYAMSQGAAAPAGDQLYRITDHSQSAYISFGWHVVIKTLAIVMIAGLGIGVPGIFLVDYLKRRWGSRD